MEIVRLTTVLSCLVLVSVCSASAAELIKLKGKKYKWQSVVVTNTKSLKWDRSMTNVACVLKGGSWVNLLESGSKISKISTRSTGARKCEGYIASIHVVRR